MLAGKAPKGAVIRLEKNFRTPTWSGSFQDGVNTAIKVGRDGAFSWIVNPSTRPVVRPAALPGARRPSPSRKQVFEGTNPRPEQPAPTTSSC